MRKMYASPKLECTPVNTRELMETATVSVGGAGNQNLFNAPERGGIGAMLMVLLMLLPMSLFAAPSVAKNGMMPNPFTVNASGKKVWFSQGNLQHSGTDAAGTWRFAENQYDRYGSDQTQDHRDLFGWGTKNTPNNTSTTNTQYTWAEWGENKISNGGNIEGVWSTLSKAEWTYLFNTRTSYRTMATVNGMPGLILMPDGWTASTVSLTITTYNYSQTITAEQWAVLEGQGCVFLPTTGYRSGTTVDRPTEHGIYWASDANGSDKAWDAYFDGITMHNIWTTESHGRSLGIGVRLVVQYWQGSGTVADPYLINNTYDWNKLSYLVGNGYAFADTYFRQTADISVTQPIGNFADNQAAKQRPFSGTYNGDGHTLNVNIHGSANFTGPFYCLSNATVKNLVVTGFVTSSYRHASGLVGTLMGPCTIENCLVSTNVSGTDYMGGLIGHSRLDNFTIVGCVFNGTLTATESGYTGGFNGWGGEPQTTNATITNCFFAGTYVNSSNGKFHPVGCFGGANATRTISNVYYTKAPVKMTDETNVSIVKNPVTYKGERVYSVTAGTGVTITPVGTPATSYNVSKLDLYGEDGIAFNGVRYGAQGDAISMNLTGGDNYSATTGTLSGSANPYTLTMAAANSEINFVPVASVTTSGNVTTNYGTLANALAAWENGSTLKLLADVTHNQTISINNTRILDLNGFGIKQTGSGRVFYIGGSGNLTINDSNPDAAHKYTLSDVYNGAGLATLDEASGSLTVNGGYITGGYDGDQGGAIYVDGQLTINGGNIIGNRAANHGGAIKAQNSSASVTMNGGRICYNTFNYQGALTIGNSTLRLYGGEISHNRSFGNGRWHTGGVDICGGTFYLHGAPIITGNYGGNEGNTNQPNDICLEQKVTIDGEMTNITPIGIMMNLGGYNGQTRGQFSFESAYVTNETASHFTPQNYTGDGIVRIGNALWVWNSIRDTHGTVAYQVTYDPRGGSAVTGQTVLSGLKASQPENPTKAGVTFVGWYKDVLFSEAWNFDSEVVNADITLYAKYSNDAVLIDDDATLVSKLTALNDGQSRDITIGRTIVAGPYNTFCLPFSLTESQIAASPLAGATLKDYNGADVTGTGAERDLNIHLTDLTEITAGKPFLIKTDVDIVNPTFTGVTVTYSNDMVNENGTVGLLVERDHVDFQGILAPYDLAAYSNSSPDYLGIGADGRLHWADATLSTGPMRGFRAFFHVKDAGAAGSPVRRGMRAQFVDDSHKVPTAVDNTTAEQLEVQKIIRNGQVLIVRDGKLYNALGAELK